MDWENAGLSGSGRVTCNDLLASHKEKHLSRNYLDCHDNDTDTRVFTFRLSVAVVVTRSLLFLLSSLTTLWKLCG